MTTEEFQILVLEKLGALEDGQKKLEDGQKKLEVGQKKLEDGLSTLTRRVDDLEKTINAVHEQTADLTEFKIETKTEFLGLKSTMSRIEIATADNWGDIARLKSIV